MWSGFKRIALVFILLVTLFSCNNKPEQQLNHYFTANSNSKVAVFLLADLNTCWRCYGLYWQLYTLAQKDKNLRLYLVTRNLKDVEREKLYKDVNFQFSDNIVHIENPSVLKELKLARIHDSEDIVIEKNGNVSSFSTGKDAQKVKAQLDFI